MMDQPVPPEAGSVGPQRKLVTVLACEDSQPTALDEQQGTEQAEQLARQLGRVQTMVVRHGGLIVWKDEPFPCRVRVQPVAALTPETAVPVFERAGASTGKPGQGHDRPGAGGPAVPEFSGLPAVATTRVSSKSQSAPIEGISLDHSQRGAHGPRTPRSARTSRESKMWKAVGQNLKDYWRILVLSVAWLGLLVSLLAWGLVDRANAKTDTNGCPAQQPVAGIPSQAPKQPAQLKPRVEPRSAIAFYQDRVIARRRIEYDITDTAHTLRDNTPLEVSVDPFLNASNSRELRATDINATARTGHGRVILDVCFNRTDPEFGSPGSYNGVVTITDPRVTGTDVTFAVTMAYPWWQLVLAVLVAMLLPAILYLWFLRGSFTSQTSRAPRDDAAAPTASSTPTRSPHKSGVQLFQEWIFSRVALMSVGAGLAAAVGIFSATYARTENWGSDYTAATALFGAAFSAFIAAATGVTAAGADKESHKVANTNPTPPGE